MSQTFVNKNSTLQILAAGYHMNVHTVLNKCKRVYYIKFECGKPLLLRLLKDMVMIIVSTELTQFYVLLNNFNKITIFILS